MKTKMTLILFTVCSFFITGCNDDDEVQPQPTVQVDLIQTEFPEAKQEVIETWNAIEQSLRDGDMDKLIAFHGYSTKFTEFKNGEAVNDAAANEAYERGAFGAVTEVVKFDAINLKVAVYGDVANLTFQSDFHLKFGEDLVVINEQTTLLFVRTDGGWKIVHEHHSPWNQ
ncbi:nuclear transport factor 2 family protein [Aurantibacter crassamenti]|uniref:nuclear transport factor 2 family protein n=1 Tax=Aurantibacter crassamenti TaxID=1837375 RepID=UPI00193A6E73|nr:nuclear transport factor 2 family protein [Aurantibacter crassamenti]MBM1108232.1 nuclear transport factor 2 family protein [Aurantibacter crassamenti]